VLETEKEPAMVPAETVGEGGRSGGNGDGASPGSGQVGAAGPGGSGGGGAPLWLVETAAEDLWKGDFEGESAQAVTASTQARRSRLAARVGGVRRHAA
jgi:hypothetical protein